MSYGLHMELIQNSSVKNIICGRFIEGNKSPSLVNKETIFYQILLVRNTCFEIYELYKNDNQDEKNVFYLKNLLLEYKTFGQITSVEKITFQSMNLSSIVLGIDYAKIAILHYHPETHDFTILCLYNLELENLSNGKKFYQFPIEIISSQTYNSLFILTNDNIITVLMKKSVYGNLQQISNQEEDINMKEEQQLEYLDTMLGEEYFQPSFNINLSEAGVGKIIKFYVLNKENEILDYFNKVNPADEKEYMMVLILYKHSGILTQNSVQVDQTNTQGQSTAQSQQNPFFKTKVNLGLCYINKINRMYEKFDVIFEKLDENAFDFLCLSQGGTSIILVFSPFCIQYINFDTKILTCIAVNTLYLKIFHQEYSNNMYNIKGDPTHVNLNLDLRGGGYLAISNTQIIFSTSNGSLYALSLNVPNNFQQQNPSPLFSIDKIHLQYKNKEGVISQLDVPYKFITMPHPGIFVLASHFADVICMNYYQNSYIIFNKILNICPIVNFITLFDKFHTKFVFTSGYDKKSFHNFLYDKLYFDLVFPSSDFQEITYLKSVYFSEMEGYPNFLFLAQRNGKSFIFEVGKTLDNISDKVGLFKDGKLLCTKLMKIHTSVRPIYMIVVIFENLIQFFDPFMKLIKAINLADVESFAKGNDSVEISSETQNLIEDKIKLAKISNNFILLNTIYNKYLLCEIKINSMMSENTSNQGNVFNLNLNTEDLEDKGTLEKQIINLNDILDISIMSISNIIEKSSEEKILKFDINTKPINNSTFLVLYKENHLLEIYDLDSVKLIFKNNIIYELPIILSDINSETFKEDFQKCTSDLTQSLQITNNIPQPLINIQSSTSSSYSTPEEIFFDILQHRVVLSIIFKNGTIVFYESFFNNKEGNNIKIKMKKFYCDFLENVDYREFFYSELSNLYIRFDNICKHPGVVLNIKGHHKVLFEINGRLKFCDFENNLQIKRSISAFSELNKEGCENGFIYYENGVLKMCRAPLNYKLTDIGLLRRNKLERFPVNCNYIPYPPQTLMPVFYFYAMIEKEFRPIQTPITIGTQNQSATLVSNKFFYYLTLRSEEPKILDQIEFEANELIVESKIVELFDLHRVKRTYIAVGINVMDEKGEEAICLAKIHLYNIENGKFVRIFEKAIFRGVISMIHAIEGTLIIAEGSRIFLYQYVPLTMELKKISVIDNKILPICSKIMNKFIVTGDIFESATWIVFKTDGNSYQDISSSSIYILGKDLNSYKSTAIDFWIDETSGEENDMKSGCILADDNKNLHIFVLNTSSSNTSEILAECADIHLGKTITELRYKNNNNKSCIYYSADDGSIGQIKPVNKKIHERLSLLSEFLFNHLPFKAGMNPKMFLSSKYLNKREKGNILEMDILNYYILLPISTQKLIAKNLVQTRDLLIQNINEIKN
jgi:hypothetical protein